MSFVCDPDPQSGPHPPVAALLVRSCRSLFASATVADERPAVSGGERIMNAPVQQRPASADAATENFTGTRAMRISRWGAVAASMALLAIIGCIDAWTGPQLGFGVLYFIPLALAAWGAGRTAALALALVATGVWYGVDLFYGLQYSTSWYGLWNGATRAASFVAIALLVAALRSALARQAAINQRLQENVKELERSEARIKEVQSKLQLVCSWTNRIRSEGRWMRFEEFLQRNFDMAFTHGISEEAVAEMKRDMDRPIGDDPAAAADPR